MSAAVIGVVWLQMDLIRTSIRVNEEKFDKNVYNALNAVVNRLEYEEREQELFSSFNGYMIRQEALEQRGNGQQSVLSWNLSVNNPDLEKSQLVEQFMSRMTGACTCPRCLNEPDNPLARLMAFINQDKDRTPLVERIDLENLQTVIRSELANRGVDTEYNYGIFSKERKSFVIYNDHYTVEDPQPKEILPGYKNIYNSKYRVDLFPGDMPSPGMLMIYFPMRTSFVWRSLWLNFLGSIVFTSLILFCFAYTINVIFRQKKLSEMKTDFINNMTHEFKTPIATISLAADSITSPLVNNVPDKVSRFANIIKQENKRMNSQVEKVLQMALLDKRDFSLNLSEVNLHEIVQRAVENISLQVEKKDGTVNADLKASNPVVQADQTHISNVINNLLDNANKYSPKEPEITVTTRNVPNGVEIEVEDKGIGMTKEARKHIFDKFYRVHTGDLHDVKGFGLGLSYVKAMVTAHKGTIDVKSELGKGSSFIVFFPFRVES
ncbi:MAG: HAMP domain-containing sensor histidine kinase [Saprospiraceae bacterium]|nr:HAMP domain-containing sensor histidine kinase [Saprospiraceae bacterium]